MAQLGPSGVGGGGRGVGWISSPRVGVLGSLTTQDGDRIGGGGSPQHMRSDLVEKGTGLKPETQAGWGSGEGRGRDGCKRRGP